MTAGTPEAFRLKPNGGRPISLLPLRAYCGALPTSGDVAQAFERIFAANGRTNGWRNGVYDDQHGARDARGLQGKRAAYEAFVGNLRRVGELAGAGR